MRRVALWCSMLVLVGCKSADGTKTTSGGADTKKVGEPAPEPATVAGPVFESEGQYAVFAFTEPATYEVIEHTPGSVVLPAGVPWFVEPLGSATPEILQELEAKNVHGLSLRSLEPSTVEHLSKMKQLEVLVLQRAGAHDADVAALAGLTQLTHLDLSGNKTLSDAAAESLAGMRKLQWVDVGSTNMTDAGIQSLLDRPSLRHLYTFNLDLTDATARRLAQTQLVTLSMPNSDISDAGLESLGKIESLESLVLTSTRVTDAGLAALEGLPKLQHLNLSATRITDEAVERLARLTTLRTLSLSGTAISPRALEGLKPLRNLEWLDCPRGMTRAEFEALVQHLELPALQGSYQP
jgi:Leucine-rich repeat (LRR) protein